MASYLDPDGIRIDTVRPTRRRMRSDDLGRTPPFYIDRGGYLVPESAPMGVDMLRSNSTGNRRSYARPVIISHFSERGRPLSHHDEDDRWDSREPSPYSFVGSRPYFRGSRANSRHRSSWGSRDPSPIGYGQLVPYEEREDEEKEAMKRQLMIYKQEMKKKADEKRIKQEVAIRLVKEEEEKKNREEKQKEVEKEAVEKFKKKQAEEEMKKKREKDEREFEYRERVRRDFGDKLPEAEITRIIEMEETKRRALAMAPLFQNNAIPPLFGTLPAGVPPGLPMIAPAGMPVSGQGQAIDMSKPVFTKMSRRHLSLKTLEAFRVDFYVDHVRIVLNQFLESPLILL